MSQLATSEFEQNARFLWWMRWCSIALQAILCLVAFFAFEMNIDRGAVLTILVGEVLVNIVATRAGHSPNAQTVFLVLDAIALTALFQFTGGPMNPFNFVYLVHIVLAAMVVGLARASVVAVVSGIGFGALFWLQPDGAHDHQMMLLHTKGMWIAFALSAVGILFFLGRIQNAVEGHRARVAALNERSIRHQHVVSLGALAAGAAHELMTPLSTILMIADDLERGDAEAHDISELKREVRRCREILDALNTDTGNAQGGITGALGPFRKTEEAFDGIETIEFVVEEPFEDRSLPLHPGTLEQSLTALCDNALRAGSKHVSATLRGNDDQLEFIVQDDGSGMTTETLQRCTEPFFSTRASTGLGLFLAQSVVESAGGEFHVESAEGRGTKINIRFQENA